MHINICFISNLFYKYYIGMYLPIPAPEIRKMIIYMMKTLYRIFKKFQKNFKKKVGKISRQFLYYFIFKKGICFYYFRSLIKQLRKRIFFIKKNYLLMKRLKRQYINISKFQLNTYIGVCVFLFCFKKKKKFENSVYIFTKIFSTSFGVFFKVEKNRSMKLNKKTIGESVGSSFNFMRKKFTCHNNPSFENISYKKFIYNQIFIDLNETVCKKNYLKMTFQKKQKSFSIETNNSILKYLNFKQKILNSHFLFVYYCSQFFEHILCIAPFYRKLQNQYFNLILFKYLGNLNEKYLFINLIFCAKCTKKDNHIVFFVFLLFFFYSLENYIFSIRYYLKTIY
nr:hypothetical protein 1634Bnrm2_p137 [Cryptomonas sp.]